MVSAALVVGAVAGPLPPTAWAEAGASGMYWTRYAAVLPQLNGGANLGNGIAAATDPGGGVVAFGGSAGVDDPWTGHTRPSSGDTYVWNGSSWDLRQPAVAPSPRQGAAMAYDGVGHTVLFGGLYRYYDAMRTLRSEQLLDTWIWDGSIWTEQRSAAHPQADGAMAAEGGGGTLLFGGLSGNETWRWDGSAWRQLQPAHSPPPRVRPGMAPESRGGVLVHGGFAANAAPGTGARYNDTWRWDGTDWTELHPEHVPPLNAGGVDLELGADGRNVMIGCCDGGTTSMRTWLWNGTDWEGVALPATPLFWGGAPMARDAAGRIVVPDPIVFRETSYTWVWQPTPAPDAIEVGSGSLQAATAINTAYRYPLVALPKDAQGVPLSGVPITFTLPLTGPSARFPEGSTSAVVISDPSGRATAPLITANAVVGSFSATAHVRGGTRSTTFPLRNAPTPVSIIAVTGTNHAMYVRRSGAAGFTNLGGYLLDPPAVARTADGTTYYIGVGTHYRLYVRTDRLGWRLLNDQGLSCRQPGAAGYYQQLHIGCRGLDNRLYVTSVPVRQAQLPPMQWSMTSAGGVIASGPAVAPVNLDAAEFTVISPVPDAVGNNVWQWNSPFLDRWSHRDHACTSQPAATADGAYYACRGRSGSLQWWRTGDERVFDAGGQIVGTPGIAGHSTGDKVTVYVQGTDRAVYTTTLTFDFRPGGSFSAPWRGIGGQVLGGVAAAMIVS